MGDRKPPIKPRPSMEAINTARLLKSRSTDLNTVNPASLSGSNSPSTPPRRPPPQPPGVHTFSPATPRRPPPQPPSPGGGPRKPIAEGDVTNSTAVGVACPKVHENRTSLQPHPAPASTPQSTVSSVSSETGSSSVEPSAESGMPLKARQSGTPSVLSSGSDVDSDQEDASSVTSGEATPDMPFYGIVSVTTRNGNQAEERTEEDEPETHSMSQEEKRVFKMKKTAEELMTTEQSYVAGLELLAKDLKETLQQAQQDGTCKGIDAEKMRLIFGVLPEIYGIHLTLLDELTQRVANWDINPKIGDIMSRFAPFLKVYGNFTMNFEQAVKTVSDMAKSDKKFKLLIQTFERQPKCKMLGISHYMLTPVQRIPRYNLLLREYLKWAPEDYHDRPAAEKSLAEISVAADKANHQIKELENFNKVMMVQLSIVDKTELTTPGGTLIRHGALMKTSRKSFQHRYFFLFNNMLIHTNPVTGQAFGEGGQYKLRDQIPIYDLRVEDVLVSPLPHAFTINSRSRSLCVAASSAEEKEEWVKDINACMENWKKIQTSRGLGEEVDGAQDGIKLGTVAPVWLHDSSTSMCMLCASTFSVVKRRHHCRCCGKVCCSGCSSREYFLEYCEKKDRVCDECYMRLGGGDKDGLAVKKSKSVPGVREVKGYDKDSVMTGYLHMKSGLRWKRYWFQVRDMALFWYRAPEDVVALGSMPLPGHTIESIKKGSHGADREHSFRIFHKGTGASLLACESDEERTRWVDVLMDVVQGM